MFDRADNEIKLSQLMQEKTASHFGERDDDSVTYEVEAEREYVGRLKVQREKIEALYSKYDILLRDLKSKDCQIKEKDKTISSLEAKCKNLSYAYQESSAFKQQNNDIKSENLNLQKAISQLEESYAYLHGQFRSKEMMTHQKYDEMENLNDQLLNKLKTLTKRYQERDQEFGEKYHALFQAFQSFKMEAKKNRETQFEENQVLKAAILQKDEDIKLLKTENQCLKQKVIQLQNAIGQMALEHEQRIQQLQKEKKCQARVLKNQIEHLKELNYSSERKWQKLREECELKDCSIKQMNMMIEEHDKQSFEALHLLKQQFAQQKGTLKQQLIQYESHIEMLERKIAELLRKEQSLYGKIKKYEVCLDAKRNLRHIEQQELDRINHLLNMQ